MKKQRLGPERAAELHTGNLCGLPDFHANDWNNKTPFNISQENRTCTRSLLAVLAVYKVIRRNMIHFFT